MSQHPIKEDNELVVLTLLLGKPIGITATEVISLMFRRSLGLITAKGDVVTKAVL